MPFAAILESLASLARWSRLVDASLGRFAAHRIARLDRMSLDHVQRQTLLRLVRRARHTCFGRDHDFAGIRTVADYQHRVPPRTYDSFWADYWRQPFPYLTDVTWPGRIPYFALSSGTTSGATKYVPLTREMLASNQKAALTTLALYLARHPGTPLFTGRLFFLGGSTALRDLTAEDRSPPYPVWAGDLSGITVREASTWMRPFTFPPERLALEEDWDEKLDHLVDAAASLPITMLSGVPSWLLVLFERLRRRTGKDRIADVWPGLRLILHGGVAFEPYRTLFRSFFGNSSVTFLETYPASEGFVAAEDPRFELLRLISDHNVFFEFIPVAELDASQPRRHTVTDIECGVSYAVVLTTCAGLWSYLLGDTIRFERRDPPLLRFTGRTRYFLSAFGEHVIQEEVEKVIAFAASNTATHVVDFHVGPLFPQGSNQSGRHRWFVEFAHSPSSDVLTRFALQLDWELARINEDYRAHRQNDLALGPPRVVAVPQGGFADWMRSRGRLGGQNKVPRMDNSGQIAEQIERFLEANGRR